MRTAYKCRAYPAPEQAVVLNRTFGCVRVVWNRTLAWRHQRYHGEHERTNFTQANAYLTAMKATAELAWLNEVSSVPLQQAIRHQQVAYTNFFDGRSRRRGPGHQGLRRHLRRAEDPQPAQPGPPGTEPGPLPAAHGPLPERVREPGQGQGEGRPRPPQGPCLPGGLPAPRVGPAGPRPRRDRDRRPRREEHDPQPLARQGHLRLRLGRVPPPA